MKFMIENQQANLSPLPSPQSPSSIALTPPGHHTHTLVRANPRRHPYNHKKKNKHIGDISVFTEKSRFLISNIDHQNITTITTSTKCINTHILKPFTFYTSSDPHPITNSDKDDIGTTSKPITCHHPQQTPSSSSSIREKTHVHQHSAINDVETIHVYIQQMVAHTRNCAAVASPSSVIVLHPPSDMPIAMRVLLFGREYTHQQSNTTIDTDNTVDNTGCIRCWYTGKADDILQQIRVTLSTHTEATISLHELRVLEAKYLNVARIALPEMDDSDSFIPGYTTHRIKSLSMVTDDDERVWCHGCGMQSYEGQCCEYCGCEVSIPVRTRVFSDIERLHATTQYVYMRRMHFREALHAFQGRQQKRISIKLLMLINRELCAMDIVTKPTHVYPNPIDESEIDTIHHQSKQSYDILMRRALQYMPSESLEERSKRYAAVYPRHIHLILKQCGYPRHYRDVNTLTHLICGHRLPDVSHLEARIMGMLDELLVVFNRLPLQVVRRLNSLSNSYTLSQILRILDPNGSYGNFAPSILKGHERITEHDRLWKIICTNLQWKYMPLVS
jgi:hypothetical protein